MAPKFRFGTSPRLARPSSRSLPSTPRQAARSTDQPTPRSTTPPRQTVSLTRPPPKDPAPRLRQPAQGPPNRPPPSRLVTQTQDAQRSTPTPYPRPSADHPRAPRGPASPRRAASSTWPPSKRPSLHNRTSQPRGPLCQSPPSRLATRAQDAQGSSPHPALTTQRLAPPPPTGPLPSSISRRQHSRRATPTEVASPRSLTHPSIGTARNLDS